VRIASVKHAVTLRDKAKNPQALHYGATSRLDYRGGFSSAIDLLLREWYTPGMVAER